VQGTNKIVIRPHHFTASYNQTSQYSPSCQRKEQPKYQKSPLKLCKEQRNIQLVPIKRGYVSTKIFISPRHITVTNNRTYHYSETNHCKKQINLSFFPIISVQERNKCVINSHHINAWKKCLNCPHHISETNIRNYDQKPSNQIEEKTKSLSIYHHINVRNSQYFH